MSKLLGIDYGDVRVGLAIADVESGAAAPFKIIENNKELFKVLKNIITDEEIEKIIVGYPVNLKSEETIQTFKVKEFLIKLKKEIKLPIISFDERMTSKIFKASGKKHIDDLAALNILEGYLTSEKHE